MTAPTLPPPPAPDREPPRPGGVSPVVLVVGAAVVLAAVVAFASHGTPVWASPRSGTVDRSDLALNVVLTVAAGAVAALAIVAIVHQLVVSGRPGAPGFGATLRRALPFIVVALGLLALVVIARTDLDPPNPRVPNPPEIGQGRGQTTQGSGRLGDFDRDGRPDIGLDLNGDGIVDHVAPLDGEGRRRPLDDGPGTLDLGELAESGRLVAAVDTDGDGVIDQYIDLDVDGDGRLDLGAGYGEDVGSLGELVDHDGDGRIDDELDLNDDGQFDAEPDLDGQDQREPGDVREVDPEPDEPRDGPDLGALGPILLGLLIAIAVVLLGAWLWSYLAKRGAAEAEPDGEDEAARDAMATSVADTIGAMLADPDPRTAIIGAYARLLEGLAASGMARLPHEAPLEHLRGVLAGLRVRPAPLRRLIELFEVARFSTHTLTESHRAAALDALRAAADDLAAAEPVGAMQ